MNKKLRKHPKISEAVLSYIILNYGDFNYIDSGELYNSKYSIDNIKQDYDLITYEKDPYAYNLIIKNLSSCEDYNFLHAFDNGELVYKNTPNVEVYGTPHVHLFTYPIGGEYFWTGHSRLIAPNINVNRHFDDTNYNLLISNCATGTYAALKDIFGNDFDPSTSAGGVWRPIDLPWNVERLAKKIPGAKIYNWDNVREVVIPIVDKYQAGYLKALKIGDYYNDVKSNYKFK